MFVKFTYNKIAAVHFINFRNKLPVVMSRSEMVMRIDFIRKQ